MLGVMTMTESLILFIGYSAVFFQAIRYIPQVVKGFRSKKVKDISSGWLIAGLIAAGLWIAYGIFVADYPIIAGNVLNFACYILLMYQKKVYR